MDAGYTFFGGRFLTAAVVLIALPCGGCSFWPRSESQANDSQAKLLTEQNKAQLAEIANLKVQNQKLEGDLQTSERKLAVLEQYGDADRKRLANFQVEREQVRAQVDELVRSAKLTGIAAARDDDLERLTKKFPLLRFDPLSGAYKLDADLAFDARQSQITADSEKLLGELAALLAQPEARELRVMIVGRSGTEAGATATSQADADAHRLGTERALAVAGYLRKIGLRGDQIAVSSVAAADAASTAGNQPAKPGRGVEIFVMGKRTPIVGWDISPPARF